MNKLIVILLGFFLASNASDNLRIDLEAPNHELIIKLENNLSEKSISQLPTLIQKLTLIPIANTNYPHQNNRSKLFSRLFKVDTKEIPPEEMLSLCKKLEKLKEVTYCSLSPIVPLFQKRNITKNRLNRQIPKQSSTPDFSDKQGYIKDTINGIYAEYAWNLGVFGEEVTFRDVEGAWDFQHEDLDNIFVGLESKSIEWIDHGTNTIGVLMAQHNGFGINGATPNAKMYTYSVYNDSGSNSDPGRILGVAKAIEDANIGDIIILELQDRGFQQNEYPDYGPADVKMPIWDLVKAATSDSILVVAASGNGKQNLDGSAYQGYRDRGDNGSILVGGGKPEDLSANSSTGYGELVRLQGWGYYVTTTGGNSMSEWVLQNKSHADYTNNYTGTSSATPVVASAMGLVQSWAKKFQNRYLGPYEMRDLLVSTGTPYTGSKDIGPLPNVKAAINKLKNDNVSTVINKKSSKALAISVHSISKSQIQLQLTQNGEYKVELFSTKGQLIYSYNKIFTKGISSISFREIKSAMYILKIKNNSISNSFKCIFR